MSTTPRTDAALYPMNGVEIVWPDFARTLETELAAAKAEAAHYISVAQKATDDLTRLRADNLTAHQMACAAGLERDQLRAEVKRLNALGSWAHTCIHHTDDERKAWVACPCCANARAERAEAELDAIKQGHGELGKYEQLRLKNAELYSIIERASVQFFHGGTDGEILIKMLTILNEAK